MLSRRRQNDGIKTKNRSQLQFLNPRSATDSRPWQDDSRLLFFGLAPPLLLQVQIQSDCAEDRDNRTDNGHAHATHRLDDAPPVGPAERTEPPRVFRRQF